MTAFGKSIYAQNDWLRTPRWIPTDKGWVFHDPEGKLDLSIIDPSGIPGYFEDEGNCTVIALAASTGIDYRLAHLVAEHAGRRTGEAFDSPDLVTRFNLISGPDRLKKVETFSPSLAEFVEENPRGRFYVRRESLKEEGRTPDDRSGEAADNTGHAYAIVAGKIVNGLTPQLDEQIAEAWCFSGDSSRLAARLSRVFGTPVFGCEDVAPSEKKIEPPRNLRIPTRRNGKIRLPPPGPERNRYP